MGGTAILGDMIIRGNAIIPIEPYIIDHNRKRRPIEEPPLRNELLEFGVKPFAYVV